MKTHLLTGTLMLAIGIAVGWLAKPAAAPPTPPLVAVSNLRTSATPVATEPAAEPPVPGKRAQREPAPAKPSNTPTDEQMEQARKMQGEMAKSMINRQRATFEQHIERLTENLDLTADQKNTLTAWLDEQMKKLDGIDFSDPKSMTKLPEALSDLTNKSLEDQLAASLTDDQKTDLVEFKEREHRGKVDTLALKNLSKLQGVIEFEEGQRDEVYQVLADSAEASILAEDAKPDFTKMFTEGMGIEMDPYDLGIQQALTESMGDLNDMPKSGTDQKQMASQMREIIDHRIDARIEQLRPVLTARQLDQYRAELKSKGMGLYGTVLMGLEAGQQ